MLLNKEGSGVLQFKFLAFFGKILVDFKALKWNSFLKAWNDIKK